MVFGLVASAATSGQIMQRTGRYKLIMQTGLLIAGVGIFSMSFLSPTSGFLQEILIMALTGVGLGALMPTLNLAVQNEFGQKDLGTVTAATQLFRNLGSTVGVAVFGGILTAGVAASLGNIQKIPYVEFLSQQPQSSQSQAFDLSKADADTALNLNTHDTKQKIDEGLDEGLTIAKQKTKDAAAAKIAATQLPEAFKIKAKADADKNIEAQFAKVKDDFETKQEHFNHDVKYAFSDSLRGIFYLASGLMVSAFIFALFIREKELLHGVSDSAPGIA